MNWKVRLLSVPLAFAVMVGTLFAVPKAANAFGDCYIGELCVWTDVWAGVHYKWGPEYRGHYIPLGGSLWQNVTTMQNRHDGAKVRLQISCPTIDPAPSWVYPGGTQNLAGSIYNDNAKCINSAWI